MSVVEYRLPESVVSERVACIHGALENITFEYLIPEELLLEEELLEPLLLPPPPPPPPPGPVRIGDELELLLPELVDPELVDPEPMRAGTTFTIRVTGIPVFPATSV